MLRKRVLVIGLGRFGASLAEELAARGCDVIVADRSMETVARVKDRVAYAVQLDATDPEALRSVEAASCATAVVAVGEDFESAVLCVAALKEVGVAHVVARARTSRQARIQRAVGASEVIEVEAEMGRSFARALIER